MGNKFLFVILLFFAFQFQAINVVATGGPYTPPPAVGSTVGQPLENAAKAECTSKGGTWDGASVSCSLNGTKCPYVSSNYSKCLYDSQWVIDACEMDGTGTWDKVNNKCVLHKSASGLSCGDNAKGSLCTENPEPKHYHCSCDYADTEGGTPKAFEVSSPADLKLAANKCPSTAPVAGEKVEIKDKAAPTGLACLQQIRENINKCKGDSENAVNACNMKSEKNAETRQSLTSLANMSRQLIHVGTAEQCKNMGLVTGAAGYGLNNIQKGCKEEMSVCVNSCADLSKYSTAEKIKADCATAAQEDVNVLEQEANELAAVMRSAKQECETDSDALLKQVGNALTSAVSSYATAAQCENQVSSLPTLTNLSLNSCISNPNAAGCPVNCATNPSSAQCTCLTNPSAAGCKNGAGSQLAGNPNAANQTLPSLSAGGLGSKLGSTGSTGSSGLGDLSMGDASELNPLDQKPATDSASPSMFGQAGSANAGGGGGTGGGEGNGKNGKGGEASGEEPGLFGGVFQNLKNAAGSLFGSGSSSGSSASKKSSTVTSGVNAAGLKPVVGNKALRGIASNGKSCFVDAKGTEFCFGKKNMDIFKMMNAQYSNQYNTLITDK